MPEKFPQSQIDNALTGVDPCRLLASLDQVVIQDDIRSSHGWTSLRPYTSTWSVVCIHPAVKTSAQADAAWVRDKNVGS
jgi:hypothetical protein